MSSKKWKLLQKAEKQPKLVVLPLVAVLLVGFVLAWIFLIPHGQRVDSSTYQVVYLDNGQAYFGKLQNTSGEYLVMTSPYTAQDVKAPDQTDSEKDSTQTTLLPVKSQVYGPQDSIALRAEKVLFWQNLEKNSKITQAIDAKNSQ